MVDLLAKDYVNGLLLNSRVVCEEIADWLISARALKVGADPICHDLEGGGGDVGVAFLRKELSHR